MADSRDVTTGQRLVCILLSVPVSALVGGCALGSRRLQRPEATLAAYAEALSARDSAHAYALLSAADRQALDRPGYERLLARDAPEAAQLAAQLAHQRPVQVTAQLTLEDGSELQL